MNNIVQTVLVCVAIIGGALLLSGREMTIKDATTHPAQWWVVMNSIAVVGEGKVFAEPDVFLLSLSVSTTKPTTAEAQQTTQALADTLVSLSKTAGVAEKDIQTTEMSIYPEYDYMTSTNKVIWYRSTHGMLLKVRDLKQVDTIISQVTFDNSIQITSMGYDIDDKTDLYSEARKLWFAKAKQKAEELASLAGVSLSTPLSISDQVGMSIPIYPPLYAQGNVYRAEAGADMVVWPPSLINPGQLEVTVTVSVVYGIE